MPQFLLELFQEEIPARMQAQAADDLKRLILRGLTDRGLAASDARVFVTPRRLALVIDDLPAASADVREELKGPRTTAPDAALAGFLKKTGLTKDQLTTQADAKGEVYLAVIERPGRAAAEIIPEVVVETIKAFPWPKSMKWEPSGLQWVRPLRSLICLFDGKVVSVEIAGLTASNVTRGHRQMANATFEVADFADYESKLRERRVILDPAERRAMVDEQAEIAAANAGLVFRDDDELLAEVAGLVEYPVVLTGAFDPSFLDVPQEVLISTMRKNQKYFALTDANGKLAEKFLVVANLEARDGGKAIIEGNEKVVRARLSDAKFFWDLDRQTTLESRLPKLKDIVFHAKLGTQADRIARIERLAGEIAARIGADVEQAKLAARLCKADLVSGTVGEFPEVQGIIGGYLAKAEGLPAAVATAIADHYKPQGPGDSVPTDPVAIAVALADKLDTLVGFFAIDEKPTGSKDPFALRRAALGVVRIVLDVKLRLDLAGLVLKELFERVPSAPKVQIDVADAQPDPTKTVHLQVSVPSDPTIDPVSAFRARTRASAASIGTMLALKEFLFDRLTVQLRANGSRYDLVAAVVALADVTSENEHESEAAVFRSGLDLVLLVRRVEALQAFLATDDGANLLAGYKRAANILRIEEKKDKASYAGAVDPGLLASEEERSLYTAIATANDLIADEIAAEKFDSAMGVLANLRGPVDAFFEKVKVNDDDPAVRTNRLNLLARIKQAAHLVADFSKIEG
ncbi:Glycine--tRNA ligase beta subunit [Alphaproteobacteria bacterium SO-S41]|nr:Glycine--tRNA ligase beta subunit [Alphaproteobacteria bacterium SO-S41]